LVTVWILLARRPAARVDIAAAVADNDGLAKSFAVGCSASSHLKAVMVSAVEMNE